MKFIIRSMDKMSSMAVWDLAFRPFFILASLASVFSLILWLLYLNTGSVLSDQQLLSPLLWHIHEMFFAFTLTMAIGFILTAVQTWTGLRSLHGSSLVFLTAIWISIRILLLVNSDDVPGLLLVVMVLQALWWLIVLRTFYRLLTTAGSKRNYIFLPLLTALMIMQLSFLYLSQTSVELVIHLAHSAMLIFSIIVGLVAGRVIPMFTRNALVIKYQQKIKATPLLDKALLAFSILGSINFLLSYFVVLPLHPAWVLFLVGGLHLLRLIHWGSLYTLTNPLLWSLHFSYFCLASGLILIALSFFSEQIRIADAFHLITLGVFGGMILAMITRVSLGHTGRALQINPWLSLALFVIFIAASLRVILAILGQHLWAWNSSALLWIFSYSVFLIFFIPLLIKPRDS